MIFDKQFSVSPGYEVLISLRKFTFPTLCFLVELSADLTQQADN